MTEKQHILITQNDPKGYVSESYRILRTNLQFYNFEKQYKMILITSSGVGEGKSTVVSNLAIIMAQSGSKVLLLDADLRRPNIYKIFNISNTKGLTNILISENENYKNFIQKTETENLDIITSGPIPLNPSELLGSQFMKNFLEYIKNEYDFIFIDSPPAGIVTDAVILSTIADGVILVVNSGKVSIQTAEKAKKSLEKVNAKIMGVVLNNIKINKNRYYEDYYYGKTEGLTEIKKRKPQKKQKNKKDKKND